MSAAAILWIHRNLFAKPFDIVLSVVVIPLTAWAFYAIVHWSLFEARWGVVGDSMRVLMTGTYPADQTWRAWFSVVTIVAMFGGGLGLAVHPRPHRVLVVGMLGCGLTALIGSIAGFGQGALVLTCSLVGVTAWKGVAGYPTGRRFVLPGLLVGVAIVFLVFAPPGLQVWGGLLLSVILTIVVSILTLPFGILLAFGRQSRIASLRIICTAYIETMRSVPLILVVYWVWIAVPLLAPDTVVPSLMRGMVGYALFFAAYVAEYVRSGLQAVPKGQVEAARSLGMSTWARNVDIVLPQALRVVVPALVGQILDIFNGATLVFIIGLTDFLRAGQMILADPQNSGKIYEIYFFLFAVYLGIGAAITYASRRMEAELARGAR